MGSLDQRPYRARFDHQQLAVLDGRHGSQFDGIVEHGLLASAFARKDAAATALVAIVAVGADLKLAGQHDEQSPPAPAVDPLAARHAHDRAAGEHRHHLRIALALKQLQGVDGGAESTEGSDLVQDIRLRDLCATATAYAAFNVDSTIGWEFWQPASSTSKSAARRSQSTGNDFAPLESR